VWDGAGLKGARLRNVNVPKSLRPARAFACGDA
jgi:hypothetical protein